MEYDLIQTSEVSVSWRVQGIDYMYRERKKCKREKWPGACIIIKLASTGEDDDSNLRVA